MGGYTTRGSFRFFTQFWQRDSLTFPTNYFVALCTVQNEQNLDNAAATDEGGGVTGIPVTAHGYVAGTQVKLEGTVNYNGAYLVLASSTANRIDIDATFVAETFTGAELVHEMPGPDTLTMGTLTEIAAGNGYTSGGISLSPNTTDFVAAMEDFTLDLVFIRLRTILFTASGGPLPSSGRGARYFVLTDDDGVVANREVYHYWDLVTDRSLIDTESLRIDDSEMQGLQLPSQ